ncbi:MAG: alkaline phosphatase [Myxococcota bacterium]
MRRTNLLLLLGIVGCTGGNPPPVAVAADPPPPKIKNIILMIGDGMGPQQVGLLDLYAQRAQDPQVSNPTAMRRFMQEGYIGFSRHDPAEGLVVDSACSASQIATGVPSLSESIGLDAKGMAAETVLERAQKQGRSTGLVSDTRLTHATPASFAAHVPHRSMENEIAEQLIAAKVDVMLSGGIRHFLPNTINGDAARNEAMFAELKETIAPLKSKRKDDRNLLMEAREAGYTVVTDRELLRDAQGERLLGLFSYSGMLDGIAYHAAGEERKEPSLAEMTEKAIDWLAKDEDGFFLMVEGGQIDWAAHGNDAGTMLHEMVKFDEAIEAVYNWAKDRDDTLVIITADHETGGFGMSYSRYDVPDSRVIPGGMFDEGSPYAPNFNFGVPEQLDKMYAQKEAFYRIFMAFGQLEDGQKTPATLMEMVNEISAFDITLAQAERILASEPNAHQVEGHKYLSAETFPKFNDFEAFYVYGEDSRTGLLARELGEQQNIVWGTGTHTHTPVTVIAWGPEAMTQPMSRMMHHTEIGQALFEALR